MEGLPSVHYLLLEAEIEKTGVTLGTIGSRIVAEVIEEHYVLIRRLTS